MTELIQTLFVAQRRRSDQQRYVRFVLFLVIMTGINQAIQHPQRQFMWDDKSQEIISEWKEYYDKCSIFLKELEQNGPANLVIPKKPAIDLTVLFPAKEKKQPLAGKDLHEHLIKNLIHEEGFSIIIPLSHVSGVELSNLETVKQCLKTGYKALQKHNATALVAHLDFGEWLCTAFELFGLKKSAGEIAGSWGSWLQKHVGVSERYDRELREMSKLLSRYPKFRKLGISFKDLRKHKSEIGFLLKNDQFAAFWVQR